MVKRGATPRTLLLGGGLAVLGLGALFLPLMPSQAQSPPGANPLGVERSEPRQRHPFQDTFQALEKAQQEVRRMQKNLEHFRQILDFHSHELQVLTEQLQKSAKELAPPVERKTPSRGAQVSQEPGGGGFPGNPAVDMDKRLREVERKLDLLIQMMPQSQLSVAPGDPRAPAAGLPGKFHLPDIAMFLAQPSDRFLVDAKEITGGHPFKGINSAQPHAGAHVHFDNSTNRWPKGGSDHASYPAVYAVADGIVSRIDTHFPLSGGNDRYGLDLMFAKDGRGSVCRFCYSIEPMAPEPSKGFYKKFLSVREGQRVSKGDVIAYLYTPPKVNGCHIHFHLMMDGRNAFLAPAIFTPEVVKDFHEKCRAFREHNGNNPIPPCMGYRIGPEENPFGTRAKERL